MKKSEIIHRQQKVWQYYVQSYNQEQIAKKIKVSKKTVSRDLQELKKNAVDWYNKLPEEDLFVYYKKSVDCNHRVIYELWQLYEKTKDESKKIQILNSIESKSRALIELVSGSLVLKELQYIKGATGEQSISKSISKLWKLEELVSQDKNLKQNTSVA